MSVLKIQKERHVYLTNGLCENTDQVSHDELRQLGLAVGWYQGEEYPLADAEGCIITSDGFYTKEGYYGLTGYATLFNGTKWLTAIVEIEWSTPEKTLPMHAVTIVEAYILAQRLAARATTRLETIGGYAEVEPSIETVEDRFCVCIHIPMEWGVTNLRCAEGYIDFLTTLMG